jgi:hypothetical protein
MFPGIDSKIKKIYYLLLGQKADVSSEPPSS